MDDLTDRQRRLEEQIAAAATRRHEIEQRMQTGEVSASRDLQAMDQEVHQLASRQAQFEEDEIALLEEEEPLDSALAAPAGRVRRAGRRGGPARGRHRRGREGHHRGHRRRRGSSGRDAPPASPTIWPRGTTCCGPVSEGWVRPGWWGTGATAATSPCPRSRSSASAACRPMSSPPAPSATASWSIEPVPDPPGPGPTSDADPGPPRRVDRQRRRAAAGADRRAPHRARSGPGPGPGPVGGRCHAG